MDSIFLDNSPDETDKISTLRISEIEPRKSQPRKYFDVESLSQLADSIAANGIIQPIVVREAESSGYYQIIAGERRWRAAKQAGLSEVPVIILDADDKKAAEYALIENIQREDLNPLEEAAGLKSLIEDYSMTQEKVAKEVGKSRTAVTNSLRLLELPSEVKDMIESGLISAGHGRALLGLNDKSKITDAAQKTVFGELSVRSTEELVRTMNAEPQTQTKKNEVEESYYRSLEEKVSSALGCKVKINRGLRRRSITVSYKTTDQLETLINKLTAKL